MFGSRQTAGQSTRPKTLPIYISSYINDYGQPWTSSDPNPKMRFVYGRIAGSCRMLLATTDQMASSHVPSARSVSTSWCRPIGVACDGTRATLTSVTTTSTAARTREPGKSRSDSANERQEVRALHVPYRGDTQGLSRLITVSRNRCSTALSCACHVVPKLTTNNRFLRRASLWDGSTRTRPGWWGAPGDTRIRPSCPSAHRHTS